MSSNFSSNNHRSISKMRLHPCQSGASTKGAASWLGGFFMAHQTATISWSSTASLPYFSILSRVLSRKELVKCVKGDLLRALDGKEELWKVGSTSLLYSGNGSSCGVVISRGNNMNRSSGRPWCKGVDTRSSLTAYGSAKKLTGFPCEAYKNLQ